MGAFVFFGTWTPTTKPTRSLTVSSGPIDTLLPHAHQNGDSVSSSNHGVEVESLPVLVPEGMWVTEMEIDVTDAPRSIIHHAQLHAFSPDTDLSGTGRLIAIFGQESSKIIRFPAPSGEYLEPGTILVLSVMFHNPVPPRGEGGVYKDVVASITVRGVSVEKPLLPVSLTLLQITDGTQSEVPVFHVPAWTSDFTLRSEDNPAARWLGTFTAPENGWLISLGGHQHASEGGIDLSAYLNGKKIRSYHSFLLDPAIPWSWHTNLDAHYVRIHAGDDVTLSTIYKNETSYELTGAMGMLAVFYVPDEFDDTNRAYWYAWHIRSWWHSFLYLFGIR